MTVVPFPKVVKIDPGAAAAGMAEPARAARHRKRNNVNCNPCFRLLLRVVNALRRILMLSFYSALAPVDGFPF